MKRILSFTLALIMVLSVVCTMGFTVMAEETGSVNLAAGKSYVTNGVSPSYPDTDGKELTDGTKYPTKTSAVYGDPVFAGFIANNIVNNGRLATIVLDLGDNYVFDEANIVLGTTACTCGVNPPKYVKLYTSTDNSEFTLAQTVTPDNPADSFYVETPIEFEPVSARYVKFEFTDDPGRNLWWVSEVEVFACDEIPEGAITIDRIGYHHQNGHVQLLAGDGEKTLGALTALGLDGDFKTRLNAEKDLNWHYVYIVDSHNIIVGEYELLGRDPKEGPNGVKTNVVVPADCYVLAIGGTSDSYACPIDPANVNVGDLVTLYNVNVDRNRGKEGSFQPLQQAFTVAPHTHTFDDGEVTLAATLAKTGEKVYTCEVCGTTKTEEIPVVDVQKQGLNIAKGAVENKLPYDNNPASTYNTSLTDGRVAVGCNYGPDQWYGVGAKNSSGGIGSVVLDFEKEVSGYSTRIHTMHDSGSGIQIIEKITVSISSDNATFTELGSVSCPDNLPYSSGEWLDVDFGGWKNFRYIKYEIKYRPNFSFIDEIEVFGTAELPDGAKVIDYAGCYYEGAAHTEILAGDNMTLGQLSKIGMKPSGDPVGAEKNMQWWECFVIDAHNIVKEAYTECSETAAKNTVVCPEGGYLIINWGGSGSTGSLADILQVGNLVTLYNINVEDLNGVADAVKLSNGGFSAVAHTHTFDDGKVTTESTLAKNGAKTFTCTECGTTRVEALCPVLAENAKLVNGTTGTFQTNADPSYAYTYSVTFDKNNMYIHILTNRAPMACDSAKIGTFDNYILSGTHIRIWVDAVPEDSARTSLLDICYDGTNFVCYDTKVLSNDYSATLKAFDDHSDILVTVPLSIYSISGSLKLCLSMSENFGDYETVKHDYLHNYIYNGNPEAPWTKTDLFEEITVAPTLPEGAIQIDRIGYHHEGNHIQILAGDGMTVGELTKLGGTTSGKEKDLNWFYVYIVNKHGAVIEELEVTGTGGGEKNDKVCPEGGYIIAYSRDRSGTAPDIKAGDLITLYNIDVDAMRGVADYQIPVNAGFRVTPHTHSFGEPVTIPATLDEDGKIVKTCECGTEDITPIAKPVIQPAELEAVADGAITIDYAGLYFAGSASVLLTAPADKAITIGELGKLATGKVQDIAWWAGVVCDKDGVVLKLLANGTKSDTEEVPAGGFAIAIHSGSGRMTALEKIKVGQIVTVHNVLIDAMRGFGGTAALKDAFITYADAPTAFEIEVNVNENAILTDGTKDVSGNWGSGAGTNNVLLITNTQCKKLPMNVTVKYDLGESKYIDSVSMFLYHCAGVMIGYPEGKAKVSVSTDGTAYTSVGEFDFAAAELASGKFGTVENKFAFDAVDARYIKVEFAAGSNEAVLGATPADNKIFWEFVSMTEFEVGEAVAPIVPAEVEINVNEKAILTDGTKDVSGNWGSGAGTDNVLLIANPKCKEAPMNVTVKYDLGETKSIESVSMFLYHCAGVMIGYPEGKATVSYSADGKTYTKLGEYDFADAELELGKFGTVENKFEFDAVDARYIKVEFAAGSNEAVLGATPAEGKIYWEFVSMTEFEVGEVEAEPIAKGDITGDGNIDAFDYQMLKAYVLGSYTEATADQIARMDLNGDESIDAFDYQMLKCVVLGTYQFD